ncbi:DciA family protein [Guyparkeria sp. TX1]|uniref:DciA family protein n=1 Tax=Guyparkeria sp. TX1 TaxID=3115001 RepID=UPI003977B927
MNLERYRLNNPTLAGILDRVALIRGYQAIVDGLVPGRSGMSVQVLNVNEQTLTIGVPSAAVASRLRFEAPDLLARLHKALEAHPGAPRPADIRVRITSGRPPMRPKPRDHDRPASQAGSQALHYLAEAQSGNDLSRALERLSRAIKPTQD